MLWAALGLPYRFVVLLPVRDTEMTSFTEQDLLRLAAQGLESLDPSPEQLEEAQHFVRTRPGLSANDGLCLLAARNQSNSVLLTGDGLLRRLAEAEGVHVHGVLWIIDQLHAAGVCGASRLIAALEVWREDRTVFLPRAEIDRRLRWLRRLAGPRGCPRTVRDGDC